KLGMTQNPDARRRLRLLHFGTMVSLTPVFVIVIRDFILDRPRFGGSPGWLLLIVLLPLFIFPITLAYLILVERALDVRVVIRQSLRYLLATNTVRVFQVIFLFMVIFGVSVYLSNSLIEMNRPQQIQIIAAGI